MGQAYEARTETERKMAFGALESAASRFESLRGKMTSDELLGKRASAVEELIESEGREVLRLLLQGHLDWRTAADVCEPVRNAAGQSLGTCRPGTGRGLSTGLGRVTVERPSFESRGLGSLRPHDADLNLPSDAYSFPLRRRAVTAAIDASYDRSVAQIEDHFGVDLAKRQVEALVRRSAVDFEAFYAETPLPAPPEHTPELLVITLDQKGIVMRQDGLREATRQAAQANSHKLATRLSKGEKRNRKRMASVAAVYLIAPHVRSADEVVSGLRSVRAVPPEHDKKKRPKPHAKRVWASLQRSLEGVVDQAFDEAMLRDPNRTKRWVVLVDGDRKQLRYIRKAAKKRGVEPTILADFIHVLEYLWSASRAFHSDGTTEGEAWVLERLTRVLNGEAGLVAGAIGRSATKRRLTKKQRSPVDRCIRYLKNLKPCLRYDQALADGLPIATGVIEGACRHLIADRFDITGARWSLPGAEALLKLRALRTSGDLDTYWACHEDREFTRNHASHYANAKPPRLEHRRRRTHLEVIK